MLALQKTLFEKRATTFDHFWTSKATRTELRNILNNASLVHWKQASLGGEQEQGFEQAFSSLAYAYAKDKAPRLIDFIIGFQLVDRNEDNTKAMGLFGFKVGDQWLYGPVFFLNGDLKGHELLYIKKQDTFVPMKENWVNYLISRRPHVLGEGVDQNTHQLGGLMPNMSKLSRPPVGTKYGSDSTPLNPCLASWTHGALPVVMAMATKQANALFPGYTGALEFSSVREKPLTAALASTAAKFDMHNFLGDFGVLKTAFEKACLRYPLIKRGFDRFYGHDFFTKMAQKIKDNESSLLKRAESYIVPPQTSSDKDKKKENKSKEPWSLIPEPPKPEKNAGLYIYAADELGVDADAPSGIKENKPELTDEEREKLMKDTILIKDKRDSHATSIAYNTQVNAEMTNPSETGLYEVLEKPGKFSEMIVISNPHSGRGREDFCVVLRKDSPRDWKNIHRTNLWAKQCDCPVPADWTKYVDNLKEVKTLEKGGTYVAVHANGSGTCPFRVNDDFGDGVYSVAWMDYCSYNDRRKCVAKLDRPQDWELGYNSIKARVYINHRKGSGLRSVNGELSIPESYKLIKISDPPKPKKKDEDDDVPLSIMCSVSSSEDIEAGSKEQPIQPGNLIDLQMLFHKQASVVSLLDTGTQVVIKGPRGSQQLTKKAALISLVRDHGLREFQAREMLKEAAAKAYRNVSAKFLVKYASPYMDGNLQPGPGAPSFPSPQMGMEQMGPHNAVNAIYPQEEFMPVDGMQSQLTDPSIYDPFYQPDQHAMQMAQQAAQSGQKEVFDVAMISGMLKSVRQDSLVDRYLGDLMKALDKLGRILFMFYWHQEEFEDRYGKQDLPELEDSIRNAFEVLGDVVLFLKEKTVGGGPGSMNSTGLGSADAGEPNIHEAARN